MLRFEHCKTIQLSENEVYPPAKWPYFNRENEDQPPEVSELG